jgi:hypothetical protein
VAQGIDPEFKPSTTKNKQQKTFVHRILTVMCKEVRAKMYVLCTIINRNFFFKKRAGGVTQMVECLPSKHKVLNSNPNTAKNK